MIGKIGLLQFERVLAMPAQDSDLEDDYLDLLFVGAQQN